MAISRGSYSVGNRVYRGGSSAPTQGTVDPMGYIDRELNNPSQRRSGIAQEALRRMRGQMGGGLPGPSNSMQRPINLRTPGGQPPQQGGGFVRTMDFQDKDRDGRDDRGSFNSSNGRWSGQGGVGLGQGGGTGGGLGMSPIGKLQPPANLGAAMGGKSLPWDMQRADSQQALLGEKNRFEQDYNDSVYDIEREYTDQRRQVENQMPDARRELLENYAGRGLAYSSGYTHDYGGLEGQFANLLSQLEQGKTGGIADLLRQRGQFNDEWATRLQGIEREAARRAAEQAGDLGLGAPNPDNQAIMDALMPKPAPAPAPAPAPIAPPQYTVPSVPQPAPQPVPVQPAPVQNNRGGILASPFKRIGAIGAQNGTTPPPLNNTRYQNPGSTTVTKGRPNPTGATPSGSFRYTMPNGRTITTKDTPQNRAHIARKGWAIEGQPSRPSNPISRRRRR